MCAGFGSQGLGVQLVSCMQEDDGMAAVTGSIHTHGGLVGPIHMKEKEKYE